MLEQELQLERDLFLQLNGSDSTFFDNFFYVYSNMFTWIPLYLCFLLVFVYKKNRKEIVCVLVAVTLLVLCCDQISSGFFKPVFHRFRPTHHPDFQDTVKTVLDYRGGLYGFISGHAANSFGFAVFVSLLFRNKMLTVTIFLFAILNAYSRIYLGVHFISDIVAGTLVGCLVGWLIYRLYCLSRYKWLKIEKSQLTDSPYSVKQAHFLSGIYLFLLTFLLVANYQIVNLFFHP
jgi:undecaprenyl-diphosphatase